MISTFEAAAVAFIALIPGATYIWSAERQVGRWGTGLPDTLLRYLGVSSVLHFILAPLTFALWRSYTRAQVLPTETFPWAEWLYLGAYLVVPALCGSLVGLGLQRGWRFVRWTALKAPKAWDHLFGRRPDGWMKIKLKSGAWIGGWYGRVGRERSYAAGHPYPSDLYLVRSVDVDQRTGAFVVDETGQPHELGPGILVRWDEVEYLKFVEETS